MITYMGWGGGGGGDPIGVCENVQYIVSAKRKLTMIKLWLHEIEIDKHQIDI